MGATAHGFSKAALAGILVLGLAGCGSESGNDAATEPTSDSSTGSTNATGGPLELTVEGPPAAKCMVPNAEVLATQDTAFEGTVTELSDGTATLSVDQWFSGEPEADSVTVATPSHDLQDLLIAVDFKQGKTYLVSSLDGRVSLCGFTAESSPELESLYEEAFPN